MAINLVSLVMQSMTPDMIGRIASAFGLDRYITQTAIGAAVPSLLAGFSNVASQPGGPQKLAEAATQQSNVLDTLARTVGTGNLSPLVDRGSQMLTSLLGSQNQNVLTAAISKFAGVGQGGASSLIGMLAPVIMGTIARQQQSTGGALDPTRIAGFLSGQKNNIAAAMPAGLGDLLSGTGLLDSLGGAARQATAGVSEAAQASVATARAAGRSAAASASNTSLYWLIPAAALAVLLAMVFYQPTDRLAQQPATTVGSATVGVADVDKQLTDSLSSLRTTLTGMTDTASVNDAMPKLQQAAGQIDRISTLSGQMSAQGRKDIAGLLNPMMPTLNQLFDKVLAVPGGPAELKPTVDALRAKLSALAT